MKKILLSALAVVVILIGSLALLSDANEEGPPVVDLPTHRFVQLPATGRLMNIECGQPCAVVFSSEANAYIALLLDGDTITFKLAE